MLANELYGTPLSQLFFSLFQEKENPQQRNTRTHVPSTSSNTTTTHTPRTPSSSSLQMPSGWQPEGESLWHTTRQAKEQSLQRMGISSTSIAATSSRYRVHAAPPPQRNTQPNRNREEEIRRMQATIGGTGRFTFHPDAYDVNAKIRRDFPRKLIGNVIETDV